MSPSHLAVYHGLVIFSEISFSQGSVISSRGSNRDDSSGLVAGCYCLVLLGEESKVDLKVYTSF